MADKDRKRLFSKEQLRSLIQEENIKTTDDIQRVLKEMFGDVLQEALDAELGHNLGYEKNDTAGKETANRRNGHSSKTVRSEYGDVELAIPRDRDGEFEPVIVKKHQKNVAGIEDQIISLYARSANNALKELTQATKKRLTTVDKVSQDISKQAPHIKNDDSNDS